MHRLPQCHRGNPQVECHNIHQVNQYDTPLSPQVFIPQYIHHVFSNLNIQSDMTKPQRVKSHSSKQKYRGEKHHMIHLY